MKSFSNEILTDIINHTRDAIIILDQEHNIQQINHSVLDLFAYQHSELIGKNWDILITDNSKDEVDKAIRSEKNIKDIYIQAVGKGLQIFPVCLSIYTFKSKNSFIKILYMYHIEKNDKSDPLQDNKYTIFDSGKEKNILDEMTDGWWDWNLETNEEYLSPKLKEVFGYTDQELPNLPETWQKLLYPEDLSIALDAYEQHLKNGKPYAPIVRYRCKDGSTKWILCRGQAIRDKNGKYYRMLGTHNDITQLKETEQKLIASEEKANAILNTAVDAIITINIKGKIQSVNSAAKSIFQYSESELIGQPITQLMPLPYAEEHDQYLKNYLTTGHKKVIGIGREVSAQRKDGTIFPMHLSVSEYKVAGQRYFTGIIRNISDVKKVEQNLKKKNEALVAQNWLRDAQLKLLAQIRGEKNHKELCQCIVNSLIEITEASIGAFYRVIENKLCLEAGFLLSGKKIKSTKLNFGEGISGQAAEQRKIIRVSNIQESELVLESMSQSIYMHTVIAIPYIFGNQVLGVAELGFRQDSLSEEVLTFLESTQESIAITKYMLSSRDKMQNLLLKTQAQARNLQAQKEELNEVNNKLEDKSQVLQQQQEELEQVNEELEEQRVILEDKNKKLELVQQDLETKAKSLEKANQYKSEFLTNMSHELRTPLNSILILSQLFTEDKTISQDQAKAGETIFNSGKDLLALINDILDLSKVEANQLEINYTKINTQELVNNIYDNFSRIAKQKKLNFNIEVDDAFPKEFNSDQLRLEQILKNLLSNAIKFTEKGSIKLSLEQVSNKGKYLSFNVSDTGIGIAKDKREIIFEAFQQIDGSASRRFGGTGLGLTISKKLSNLLNGELTVSSTKNKGSTFSLLIPASSTADSDKLLTSREINKQNINDNHSNETTVLVVNIGTNKQPDIQTYLNENAISTINADSIEQAKDMLDQCLTNGIVLNVSFCDESTANFTSELKELSEISLVPIISYIDKELSVQIKNEIKKYSEITILKGAVSPKRLVEEIKIYFKDNHKDNQTNLTNSLEAMVEKEKIVLIVDDDERNLYSIQEIFKTTSLIILTAKNGQEAVEIFKAYPSISLIIMDMMMPVMDGYTAVKLIRRRNNIVPIIALTAKAMKGDKDKCLEVGCSDYLAKPVSPKQLLSLANMWIAKNE